MTGDISVLLTQVSALKLIALYEQNGYTLRFVGGCIRDALLKRPFKEVDFATDALPEQSIQLLNKNDLRHIPTGIDHGTITVLIEGQTFEITTLRRDIKTDGRHAQVEFGGTWEDDAGRRDFTVNAMSADATGRIFDYCGGQQDLATKTLRFIGNAEKRIQEDYLRILRYFRFLSVLNWDDKDASALKACIVHKTHLSSLSRERIQAELYKMLLGPGCIAVISLMAKHHILSDMIASLNKNRFEYLVHKENKWQLDDPFRRIMALAEPDENELQKIMVLSHKDKKRLQSLRKITTSAEWPLNKQLYYFGIEAVLDDTLLNSRSHDIHLILDWRKPIFPVKAEDVMNFTKEPGPLVGKILKQSEEYWADHAFILDRMEILTYIRREFGF